MRILLTVSYWLDANTGVSGATLQLADAYRNAGHDVEVLSWDDMRLPSTRRTHEFVYLAWLTREIASRSRRRSVDVIDGATADVAMWGRLRSSRRSPELLVARTHGLTHVFLDEKDRERELGNDATTRLNLAHESLDRRLVGQALRHADLALFLNQGDRDYAVERLGIDARRTGVVPNGITPAFLGRPAPEPRPGRPAHIAWVGSYDVRKGVAYAATALQPVLRANPGVKVTFFGGHRPLDAVQADYPADLHRQIEVVPHFEREALPDLLEDTDVLLFPSVAEGFSLALVEAMACALAPVATDVGAARDVVRHGVDGLIVPSRDAGALADGLSRMVRDREALDGMRRSAHARAQKYTWSHAAAENLRLYAETLERRRVGGTGICAGGRTTRCREN
jgi:glycosyltransferase involved in cell wall biosynthesis